MSDDEFEEYLQEYQGRLEPTGFDATAVWQVAAALGIPPDKAADALIEFSIRRPDLKPQPNGKLSTALYEYFGTVVVDDIGIFEFGRFMELLREAAKHETNQNN